MKSYFILQNITKHLNDISCYQVKIRFSWGSQGTSLPIQISIPQSLAARQQKKQKSLPTWQQEESKPWQQEIKVSLRRPRQQVVLICQNFLELRSDKHLSCSGADQGLEDETRRKRRRNRGASQGRRRTRAGTSLAPGMARPPLGISLVLGISRGPDLRPHGSPSSLQTTVDCDASSKLHHGSPLKKAIIVAALPLISLL